MALLFNQAFAQKLIYVYRINDSSHEGVMKVGEASCNYGMDYFSMRPGCRELNEAAKKRIREQTQTAGVSFELLYTEISAYMNGSNFAVFQDHEVHNVLERSGIRKKIFDKEHNANEWYYTDLETVKKAISAVKQGRTSLNAGEISNDKSPVILRPEQTEAIEKTIRQFKKGGSRQMLWNAKMRFGKTLSALQVIKRMNYRRTLILTHRPVVDNGWFEDYTKIFYDRPEFDYYSKKSGGDKAKEEKSIKNVSHLIYFASLQDMRGSELVGGKFAKNEEIFNIEWDLIIIDEAHEGTQTELGKSVIEACRSKNTKILHLSGTPFNLMDDFNEEEIYTWDYVMEQRAKYEWDKFHQGDPNPYSCLPRLNIYTYNLGRLFAEYADADIAFNFREFFRVGENGSFVHEKDVRNFLDLLSKADRNSNYPYSKKEYRDNFRHSLWVVPGVKEAKALSSLLQQHPVFSQFNIANVAGDGDEEEEEREALAKVRNAIGDSPELNYSITLSCGRLTTGVSVPPWTACFMLAGGYNTSASSYMQTIFRVQTPAVIGCRQKEECFVFDFAPDRTLKVIAETAKISSKAGKTTQDDRQALGSFLNFCPVIGFEGSEMKPYNTEKMLGQLKRAYVERVVRSGFEDNYLYNENLMSLGKIELEEFSNLKGIIGSTKAQGKTGDININAQGLTEEQHELLEDLEIRRKPKKELTPEQKEALEREKEARKNRDSAISILRGISIRMPLLIYGATDLQEKLDGTEEAITIDNFADLVDDLSWEEFMPKGVTKQIFAKFKKYYDPDIFREAGIKIRQMARAADRLRIEDRIERISMIFNNFRNPDKETVLTPWRVVNMHLAQAIGGWRFYDKDFKEPLTEPEYAMQENITQEVFKKDSHILEINAKSGLYALYCAYSIYRKRAEKELPHNPSLDDEQDLWKKVVEENIFLICKTPMAKKIAQRTLVGFKDIKINAHHFEDIVNQLKNKPENVIRKISRADYWKKEGTIMKFDAIVGNPPYQETITGTSDKQIYNYFYDAAMELSSIVSLITPARFLFNAGKTPKEWNEKMLHNEHFKVVKYYANSEEVFPPPVDIKGGISITLYNENIDYGKMINFTAFPELNSILQKVISIDNFMSIDSIIYTQNKFDLDALYADYPEYRKIIGSDGREKRLTTPIFQQLEVFKEEKMENSYEILGLIKNIRVRRHILRKYVEPQDLLEMYKVLLPASNGSGALGEVLSTPLVGEPLVGYTQSFIGFGKFSTKEEAEACLKYIKTKFARVMLGILKVTQHNHIDVWKYVPMQDFTSSSDIDWSKPIPQIDQQLYKKYGLTTEEISFIEQNIKQME